MRVPRRFAIVGAALGLGGLSAFAAAPVLAAPSLSVSFYAHGGATAKWVAPHSAIQLTVPNSSSYAIIVFHHFSPTASMTAPSFTTDTYGSGSPRWYIQFAGGGYLFGFPSQYPYWNVEGCSDVSGGYPFSYTTALTALQNSTSNCGGNVTGVYIVADSSQPTPAVDTLTNIQYGGIPVTK
ncbi:MAG: hypothetical protein ACYCS9_11335 [Candidatus Dormibacteria bacterium]